MAIFDIINSLANWGSKSQLFGTKPIIPPAVTSADVVSSAAAANQANLPAITSLAKATNIANAKDYQDLLRSVIPNYDELVSTVGANTLSAAKGELPKDVADMIKRTTAEGAAAGGYQGSQVQDFEAAKQLGLTSLQMQGSFDRWLQASQQLTTPGFMDITKSFISPEQQIGLSEGQYNRDLLAAGVSAAPDPAKRGVMDLEMGVLGQILSIYSGGAGYTQTYKPNYGGQFSGSASSPGSAASSGGGGFLSGFGFGGGDTGTMDTSGGTLGGGGGGMQWGGLAGIFA